MSWQKKNIFFMWNERWFFYVLCGLFLQICNHPRLAPPCDENDNNDQNGSSSSGSIIGIVDQSGQENRPVIQGDGSTNGQNRPIGQGHGSNNGQNSPVIQESGSNNGQNRPVNQGDGSNNGQDRPSSGKIDIYLILILRTS